MVASKFILHCQSESIYFREECLCKSTLMTRLRSNVSKLLTVSLMQKKTDGTKEAVINLWRLIGSLQWACAMKCRH